MTQSQRRDGALQQATAQTNREHITPSERRHERTNTARLCLGKRMETEGRPEVPGDSGKGEGGTYCLMGVFYLG